MKIANNTAELFGITPLVKLNFSGGGEMRRGES